jgi:uncharacterized protein (TIGR02466 family)
MTIRLGSPDFLRMFPTVVGTLQLEEEASRAINPAILRGLAEIRTSAGEPSAGENWQSGHALHRRDEFHALVEAIHATTRKVLSFIEIASDDFEITGCWANVNGIGASHGVHTHPNNFLSGVYYVQTQAGADTINFHDPRVQTAILRPPVKALTADNTDQVVVAGPRGNALAVSGLAPPLCRSQ